MVGKRNGRESVVFSIVERATDDYIAIKIPSKTVEGVKMAWNQLREQYGAHFSQVFNLLLQFARKIHGHNKANSNFLPTL